jgi:UDP-glucose 4-epimerase
MKILVTGHKGYIGSKLFNKLDDGINIIHGIDLKDGRDVLHHLSNTSYDYVFHLAAFPSVQQSVEEPSDTFRNNAYATSVLLEWAKNHNVKRVIFSSSAAAASVTSPYGLHKRISEQECRLYSQLYGLDTVCLRYYNVYSEDQIYGGSYSTAISAWMQMIREGKELRIDGDGEQTRDFVHVDDVVSANIFCMNQDKPFAGAVHDVASGASCSLNSVREVINKNHNVTWNEKPERKGDIKHSHSDISGLLSLGWKPFVAIEDGLQRCFSKDNLCVESLAQ